MAGTGLRVSSCLRRGQSPRTVGRLTSVAHLQFLTVSCSHNDSLPQDTLHTSPLSTTPTTQVSRLRTPPPVQWSSLRRPLVSPSAWVPCLDTGSYSTARGTDESISTVPPFSFSEPSKTGSFSYQGDFHLPGPGDPERVPDLPLRSSNYNLCRRFDYIHLYVERSTCRPLNDPAPAVQLR